jgi:hypothetical protein
MSSSFIAGILAGIAGLLVFLIVHHLWIMPIWFILPLGLVIAVAGGLAVGWAYSELLPHLPSPPWTVLAVIALIWAILLPSIVVAELRQPLFVVEDGNPILAVSIGRASLNFILELLVTSLLMGTTLGWLIGRTWRAAGATALAGLIFALGPGHNIPLIGGGGAYYVGKELAIMMSIIVVSAVVLVAGQALLTPSKQEKLSAAN